MAKQTKKTEKPGNSERKDEDDDLRVEPKLVFAREFVRTRSKRLAVELSGSVQTGTNADKQAWKWMQDADVRAEIRRLEKIIERNCVMTAAELDAHVEALVRANPQDLVDPETGELRDLKDIPRELAHAVSEYTVERWTDKEGMIHTQRKVKLHNKKECSELLMKRKQLLKDHSNTGEVLVRFSFGKAKPQDALGGNVRGSFERIKKGE